MKNQGNLVVILMFLLSLIGCDDQFKESFLEEYFGEVALESEYRPISRSASATFNNVIPKYRGLAHSVTANVLDIWKSERFKAAMREESSQVMTSCQSSIDTEELLAELHDYSQKFHMGSKVYGGRLGAAHFEFKFVGVSEKLFARAAKHEWRAAILARTVGHEMVHLLPDHNGNLKYDDNGDCEKSQLASYVVGHMTAIIYDENRRGF